MESIVELLLDRSTLLTVEEVSELLNVSVSWVYKASAAGSLPSYKLGGPLRFDPITVAQWLQRRHGAHDANTDTKADTKSGKRKKAKGGRVSVL